MIILNIIPREQKREIELEAIFDYLKKALCLLVIVISAYSFFFLLAQLVLQLHFVKTVFSSPVAFSKTADYSNRVKQINTQLNYVNKIQREAVAWSYLLQYLAENAGPGIRLSKISISKERESLSLEGFARTRDELLSLKDSLEKMDCFSEVDFPIKNLLERENINFNIGAKFRAYEFRELQLQ